jgi:aspartyl-tRNA(Asn)/glutamyl-tRNA(Gln) amidotransferase subunit A
MGFRRRLEDETFMSTATHRLEQALARIRDPHGEGARACLTIYEDTARREAAAADRRAGEGSSIGPLDGAIVSIKDLFDVAGEATRAGSKILEQEQQPAARDAEVVRRLREAGAVIVAKTNMTEFAFSGVGANPHYGTPGIPADRKRVPGGSSSGAAVAVADGMCEIAIGSDTGGSTRIPAALTGVVGFKPSKPRISTEGVFPLSTTLDSIGPLARSVADCARADAVMAGEAAAPLAAKSLHGVRIGLIDGLPLQAMDEPVAAAFNNACARLETAGVTISRESFALFDAMMEVHAKGGIVPAEAYNLHRDRLTRRFADIDPMIAARIKRAEAISPADYDWMLSARRKLVAEMDKRITGFDALVMPTVPILAPTIAEVSVDKTFAQKNALLLRNTSIVNFFDLCAISLPLMTSAGLPSGLSLVARHGHDRHLFELAQSVEQLLSAA